MGGDPPKPDEATEDMIKAYIKYGPDAIRATADVAEYPAEKMYQIEARDAPRYAALQNQITREYGPEARRLESILANQAGMAASEGERAIAEGPGRDLVRLADEEQRMLDKPFYDSREAVGRGINQFLGSYSPTELTPGEIEQINRGISGRQGPTTQSQLQTIKNAQTFGDATTNRWKNFGQAVSMASSALPSLRSGLTGFEIATRRPLTSGNPQRLSNPDPISATSAFNTTFGFGNNLLGEIGSTQRSSIAKQKDTFDKIQSGASSFGSVAGGIGSMI